MEVFPDYHSGISLEKKTFGIDHLSNTQPIIILLYRMAPIMLKQLKDQLKDILDVDFIRLSIFSSGAPVSFFQNEMVLSVCILLVNN